MDLLIVDDHLEYINRLIELISIDSELMYISTANDYAGAVASLSQQHPHIIILDVNLPDKSGIDVLRYIKKMSITSRVIMITNHATPFYKTECLALGADYFLDKTNDFELIGPVIDAICSEIRN